MSKSAIFTANTTTQALASGSTINLGNIIRRFGCNCNLNGDSINVSGAGYYDVDAQFTITATNAGTANITLLRDGVAVQGATASVSLAVGDVVTVGIDSLIREYGCCANNSSNLTFVLSGTSESVTNVAIVVQKV